MRDRLRLFRKNFGFDEATDDWARSVGIEGRVDLRLAGEEGLADSKVHVSHLPRHCRGHFSAQERDNSVIAIGSAFIGEAVPVSSGEPAFPRAYRHGRKYLDSIECVRALGVRWAATAHYGFWRDVYVSAFLGSSRHCLPSTSGT